MCLGHRFLPAAPCEQAWQGRCCANGLLTARLPPAPPQTVNEWVGCLKEIRAEAEGYAKQLSARATLDPLSLLTSEGSSYPRGGLFDADFPTTVDGAADALSK